MRKPFCLNEDVKKELKYNFELFCAFREIHGSGYDWEILPLHNPDWVAIQKNVELRELGQAKEIVLSRQEEYEEFMKV
jgi:hypothetical protein